MALEFEVEVFDPLDRFGLGDRQAVDQEQRRYQHLVEVERVAGRHPQIARRHPRGQRASRNDDRQDVAIAADKAAVIGAPADPLDRLGLARHCHHQIADLQFLDRLLAT